MLTIFEKMLLGHLIGDYLLQSKKMALQKSAPGLSGWCWCLAHCLIYTAAVCLLTGTSEPLKIGLVFLSHFPIDRYHLAERWLKIIGGRNLIAAYESKDKFHEIDLCFSTIVYVVVDNTLHILLMTLIFSH